MKKWAMSVLNKYEDKLPPEWLEVWKTYGYGAFMNGYFRVIDPEEYGDFYKKSTLRGFRDEAIPVMATAFGDIIAFILKMRDGEKKWSLECAYTFIKYSEAVEKLGKLKIDQCFGYDPILTKRGKEKLDDLRIVDTKEYIRTAFEQNGRIEDPMPDEKVIDVSYAAKKEKKPKRVIMYEKKLLKPEFDIYEFAKCYPPREINIEEEGYNPIKPAIEYFKKLEIPASLSSEIEEIMIDGGDDIYGQIYPFWDGEDEYFDLKRVSDEELSQFPNLKRIQLINSVDNMSKTLLNRLKKHGIELVKWN